MASTVDIGDVTPTSTPTLIDDILVAGKIPWQKVVVGVVLFVLVMVTFLGNLLVLIAVAKEKRLQTVFNYYIVNLAITDVSVAATAMSFYAIDMTLGYWPFGEFMCGFWVFCDYGMTFASVFTLLVISVDRLWSVSWIHHYRTHHTKKKAIGLIVAAWVVMVCLWLPPCIIDRLNNWQEGLCLWEPSKNREFVIVIATIGHHGSFAALLFCYIRVFMFMQKRTKAAPLGSRVPRRVAPAPKLLQVSTVSKDVSSANQPGTQAPITIESASDCTAAGPSSNQHLAPKTPAPGTKEGGSQATPASTNDPEVTTDSSSDKRERRIFITLTYILAGYVICWFPFHVVFDISAIDPDLVPMPLYLTTFWMTYVNSTINPILYNFSSPEFRKAFRAIVCRKQRDD